MNKDINIVLNGASAAAASFDVADGVVSISGYPFPWKKIQKASKTVSVAGTAGVITATPGALAANTEYAFFLTQEVSGEVITERITWVSGSTAPATPDIVCDGWRSVVLAHVNAGRFKITVPAAGAVTLILPASSVAYYNLTSVSGPLGATAQTTSGVAPVNLGADLLAAGVVDSFDSDLPASGTTYTLYDWSLKLPKGKGGFNGQTDDQDVSLKLFVQEGQAGTAALVTEIDNVLAGLNPGGTGSDELLGQD